MTLLQLLEKLTYETPVGIWNIDDKRKSRPNPQSYQKVKNLPFAKIRNLLHYEVMRICVTETGGMLIQVYNQERLQSSVDHLDLAGKIYDRFHNR